MKIILRNYLLQGIYVVPNMSFVIIPEILKYYNSYFTNKKSKAQLKFFPRVVQLLNHDFSPCLKDSSLVIF